MKYIRSFLVIILIAVSSMVDAQKKVMAFDFEASLNVKDWWADNKDIILSQ